MKTIYIVRSYDYETSTIHRCFEDETDAEAFKELCIEHDSTRPSIRYDDDDEAYDKYEADVAEWLKNHPSGIDTYGSETFGVEESTYQESSGRY